jgi:nucleoprotein TPR
LEQLSTDLERALSKSADLNDRLTTQEESHRTELSSQTRLAELWERSAKETQGRNKDLENQLERVQERSGSEAAEWQAKAQQEHARAEQLGLRVQELEGEVERLQAAVETAVPMSPTGPINGSRGTSTPRAQLSPTSGVFSPSAQAIEKRGRSGLSLTQLYSELHTARQAETLQRRRAEKLHEEYAQYREEAERWVPEYQHTIQEFEQQKEDLAIMSINLQNAVSEKEEAERAFKLLRSGMMGKERETRLYQQRIDPHPLFVMG